MSECLLERRAASGIEPVAARVMKLIFEEYGDVILQVIGGVAVLAIIVDLLRPGGLLNELFARLVSGAC